MRWRGWNVWAGAGKLTIQYTIQYNNHLIKWSLIETPLRECLYSFRAASLKILKIREHIQVIKIYDTTLSSLLNKHAPKRRMRCRYQPLVPWFDSECSAARRRTRAFERRYRKLKLSADRLIWTAGVRWLHALYEKKRNLYWMAKVKDSQGNPKKLLKTVLSTLSRSVEVVSSIQYRYCCWEVSEKFLSQGRACQIIYCIRSASVVRRYWLHIEFRTVRRDCRGWCGEACTTGTKQELCPGSGTDMDR